ncbi:hypothetical protein AMJ71_03400 [candidate division TA06 bacterium SM1_40]|nr:MAG: hypothetical protein AMJ71_03400 [candidate division TA06 bacterium SM1_40]
MSSVDLRRRQLLIALAAATMLLAQLRPAVSQLKSEIEEFDARIGESEGQLEDLARQLQSARDRRRELEGEESGILHRLEQSEEELELAGRLVRGLEGRERRLTREIEALRATIGETEDDLKGRRLLLARRLRGIYLHGNSHPLQVLLGAESFTDAFSRLRGLRLVAAQDRDLYLGVRQTRRTLDDRHQALERTVVEVSGIREQAEREEAAIARRQQARQDLLEEVRAEAEAQQRLERELEQAAVELEALVAELERKRQETVARLQAERAAAEAAARASLPAIGSFGETPGTLPWPVQGEIISSFGMKKHPKYGTSTRNNGVDIRAPLGTPVRCVADGLVAYADRFLGYGKLILVEHGDGVYTLYGHLDQIGVTVGEVLAKGDVVGTVGDTGSLEGPKLHFEVRQEGAPVDPLSWLQGG